MKHIKLFEDFQSEYTRLDDTFIKDVHNLKVKALKDAQESHLKSIVAMFVSLGCEASFDNSKGIAILDASRFFNTSYDIEVIGFEGNDSDPGNQGILKVTSSNGSESRIPLYAFLGTIISATIGAQEGKDRYRPYITDAVEGKTHAESMRMDWGKNYTILIGEGKERTQQLADVLQITIGNTTPRPKKKF